MDNSIDDQTEKVMVETLCGRYRMIAYGGKPSLADPSVTSYKGKKVQRRHNVSWTDVEEWPLGLEGGTLGGAIRFMNTLADLEDNKS